MPDLTPSEEKLGAYFDNELSPEERAQIEAALDASPENRAYLEDLNLFAELGGRIDESMPSAMYWEDLPDRILARIAVEDQQEVLKERRAQRPEPASGASWWDRLWNPAARWAMATAVVGIAGVGLYAMNQNVDPASLNGSTALGPANETPTATTPLGLAEPVFASNPEEQYRQSVQRVFTTLGSSDQLGSAMDGRPQAASGIAIPSSPIQRVSLGTADQAQTAENGRALRSEKLVSPESYFKSAVQLERMGRCDLAKTGYELVQAKTHANDLLNVASGAGLARCEWRRKIRSAGDQSQDTLNQLGAVANAMYSAHVAGDHHDCARAWQQMVAYLDLGRPYMDPVIVEDLEKKLADIRRCVE